MIFEGRNAILVF